MSGPSTLRLCFAAMAPALTEAASARLKLQDSSTKLCNTRAGQSEFETDKIDNLSSPGKNGNHEPFPLCDFKKADDRVDLTSFTNGTRGDTVRSPPRGKGGGLTLTSDSSVRKHIHNKNNTVTIGRLNSFTVAGKRFSPLIDVSDDLKTTALLNGLKIMNQPSSADNGSNHLELSKNNFIINSNSSSDKLRILASTFSKSGMVNGDSGHNGRKEEEQQPVKNNRRESGDAPVKHEDKIGLAETKKKENSDFSSSTKTRTITMGMCDKNKVVFAQFKDKLRSSLVASDLVIEKPCDDIRKECVRKQAYLERKVEMLLRRLKRMKGKVVEQHAKEQLVQYVNFQHRNLQMVAKSIKSEAPCPDVLKDHFLSNEDVKNMSTSQLVKLVRDHQSNKSLPVTDNSQARFRMVNSSAIVMSPSLQAQSLNSSEQLSARVQAVENDLDSDATASSSGGESGDEGSSASPSHDITLPYLLKRAEWKWAVDRAAIVSRWTWLQAQVSDLEYKIRQQSQVHRQLRNSKGGVVLGDPPTAMDILRKLQGLKTNQEGSTTEGKLGSDVTSTTEVSPYNVSTFMSNVDKQASRLTQSLNCLSPASSTVGSPGVSKLSSPIVNNLAESPSSSVTSEVTENATENSPIITSPSFPPHCNQQLISECHLSTVPDASCQAARCRPLRSYRKRKILRTIDLYKSSVKAARLSDVRCHCYPPGNPCAMCGGRYNNTQHMDADNMSFNERVALLDPSFHPVLSFPQDIPLSIHCEGVLKSGLWQHKTPSKRNRSDHRRQKVLSLMSESGNNNNKIHNGRVNNSTPSRINFTTKIKNKYEGKAKAKKVIARAVPLKQKVNKVKRKCAKIAKVLKKRKKEADEDNVEALYLEQEDGGLVTSSRDGLSNSSSQSGFKDLRDSHTPGHRRRRTDNAFDINNIEIPHSIAASTRVEQIQYKEIVTPKWRVLGEESSNQESSDPNDSMSISSIINTSGKQLEKTNGVSVSLSLDQHGKIEEENEEIEDLSDDKYLQRHALPEKEEMKRFRNFLQYPPARRNRARSDAFLSVTSNRQQLNTILQDVSAGDLSGTAQLEDGQQEGTPVSSSLLNKSLPVSVHTLQSNGEDLCEQQMLGRRPVPVKREQTSFATELCLLPLMDVNKIEPWPRRAFPLSEDEYYRMQNESSTSSNCEPLHRQVDSRLAEPSGRKVYVDGSENHDDGTVSRQDSRATSPHPSIESMSSIGDDTGDPDWITGVDDSGQKIRNCKSESDVGDPDWNGSDNPRKAKKR